jgi:hypothetical protein
MGFIYTQGATLRELREQVENERKTEMNNPLSKKEKIKQKINKIKEIKISELMRSNNRTKILINREFEP